MSERPNVTIHLVSMTEFSITFIFHLKLKSDSDANLHNTNKQMRKKWNHYIFGKIRALKDSMMKIEWNEIYVFDLVRVVFQCLPNILIIYMISVIQLYELYL